MDIDKIKLELPSQLADICRFSFDFSNLMKTIEYLFNNNLIMIKEIKNLRTRVFDLEILRTEFDKIKENSKIIEKSHENLNISFLSMKEKFIQNDSNMTDLIKKNEQKEKDFDKYIKIIEGHDTNINNLNKVVEENVKNIKQNHENLVLNFDRINKCEIELKQINSDNIKTNELIQKNDNNTKNENEKNEKSIESLNNTIAEIKQTINSMKILMDKKNRDFDLCINNIMDNISELNTKGVKTDIKIKENNDNNLFKIAMGEIERINEKINSNNEEQKLLMDKKDKESDMIKRLIEGLQSDINNINNKIVDLNTINTVSVEEEKNLKQNKLETENINNSYNKYATQKSVEKLNENLKQLMKSFATLPNRDEYISSQRDIIARIKKLEDSGMGMMPFDSKINKLENNKEKSETNVNYFNPTFAEKLRISLMSDLTSNFREMIKKEGKNIDLTKNSQILELLKLISKHSEEINNNNKSVIDLRKTLIAIDIDKRINNILEKIYSLDEDNERCKKKILVLNQIINGYNEKDDLDENGESFEPTCLRGKIEINEQLVHNMSEKVSSIESKYKSITKEIKDDIKSNLKVESIKTLSQFREKLELFTRRFEEELRNKIDQMGLNNFEKKMNTKLYYDLKDKLNRQEMQKNNNLINRKIDSLENKISKTLVDTIIDLQMDEAPLIIKKAPNNIEVCASCNQIIQKEKENKSLTNNNESMSPNHLNNNNKSLNSLSINKFMNNSTNNKFRKTFYGFNKTQTSMPKINNVMSLKKELPDINKYN